jgi:hypothetical protein
MKHPIACVLFAALLLFVAFCGCTGTAPAPQPVVTTAVITATPTPAPTPEPDPYPNASALNTPVVFGSGTKTGEITITGYTIRPSYGWTDPSWNSPREQAESGKPLETQKGYNTKKPQDGNTFLFVYVNVVATGTESVFAPSPGNIAVMTGGKMYSYSSVASQDTNVEGELGKQYDYNFGAGGSGGDVKPGKSNIVKGFLIYEVPASFSPQKTYVITNAGAQTRGVWRLA